MLITVTGRGHSGTRAMSHTLTASGVFMGEPLNTSGDLLPGDSMYEAVQREAEQRRKHPRIPFIQLDGKRHMVIYQAGKHRDRAALFRQGKAGREARRKPDPCR